MGGACFHSVIRKEPRCSGGAARLRAGQPHVGLGRGSFHFRSRGSPGNLNTDPDHPLRRNFCRTRQPATAFHFCFAPWPRFLKEDISFWRFIFRGARTREVSWDREEGRGQGGGWWWASSIRPSALRAGLGLHTPPLGLNPGTGSVSLPVSTRHISHQKEPLSSPSPSPSPSSYFGVFAHLSHLQLVDTPGR